MTDKTLAVSEQVRQVISNALLFDMRDPALEGLTITRVKLSPDFSFADIRYTIADDIRLPEPTTQALNRARGAFKRMIAKKIKMRKVPELRFHFDEDVMAERRIEDILSHLDIPSESDEA